MKQEILFTSGYEGLDLQEFIKQLKTNDVQILIDIREIAISRKKGFSKSALCESLNAENIEYLHYRDLGSPGKIRKKLREDDDYSDFFKKFTDHLSSKGDVLEEILERIQNSICCLLCFEKEHEKCHRKIVAQEIQRMNKNGMLLKHL